MSIVGHVKPKESTLLFADGEFTMHTAFGVNGNNKTHQVFRVPVKTWPSVEARRLDISYKLLLNSTPKEIGEWINNHPQHTLKTIRTPA